MKEYKLLLLLLGSAVTISILTGCNSGSNGNTENRNNYSYNTGISNKGPVSRFADYKEGEREFYILNGVRQGEDQSLFYKSSGANSGVQGTIFPTNGISDLAIVKPIVGQLIMSTIWQFPGEGSMDLNDKAAKDLLISTFGTDVIGMYKSAIVKYDPAPSVEAGLQSFSMEYIAGKTKYWALLCRFGNLEDMKLSAAFGGGFWDIEYFKSFTSWFYKHYKDDILAYRSKLEKSTAPQQTHKINDINDLIPLLPIEQYQRKPSNAETHFREILDKILGFDEEFLQQN